MTHLAGLRAGIQIIDLASLGSRTVESVLAHYLRLSEEDLRTRFLRRMTGDDLQAHSVHAVTTAHCIAAMVVQGGIRGIAELYAGRHSEEFSAEIAVSIESPFQGRGVGSALAESAIRVGREAPYRRIEATFQRSNQAARRLLAGLSFRLRCEGEECHASLDLAQSDPGAKIWGRGTSNLTIG